VHVLDWPDRTLSLPALPGRVRSATRFPTGERVQFTQSANGITLTLPPAGSEEVDRVIALHVTR
jgi:alpha-L-fucosidase